jgi:hypothetical protein
MAMPGSRSKKRRAVIIGGSMSGLFGAAFLRRIGWDVDVYERSPVELVGRGAGIVKPQRRIRQIDEMRFVIQQFLARGAARLAAEARGKRLAIAPPELGYAVVRWLHSATSARQLIVDGIFEGVDLDVTEDVKRGRMMRHEWPMDIAPAALEIRQRHARFPADYEG